MRQIFVDESIHDRGNFIVIAAVVTEEEIGQDVRNALARSGFTPRVDEYKSSMSMNGNNSAQRLREEIKSIIFSKCKIAFAFCAVTERADIMPIAAKLIGELRDASGAGPAVIHFDQGISAREVSLPAGWLVKHGCDSKVVEGIQLADCAAHTLATLILSQLGFVNKSVSTEGQYPEPEVELAWELWTSIRYALSSGEPVGGYDADGHCEPMMFPYGIFVSQSCSFELKEAVMQRLGEVRVGCIH